MYRRSGLVVLAIGVILTYFLAFTTFDEPVSRWTRPEEESGLVQVKIECPSAWDALVEGEQVDSNVPSWVDQCLRSARTHATAAIVVVTVSLFSGIRGLIRGPAPRPERLHRLSDLLRRRQSSDE
jgi:hypothetical protein